MEKLNIVGVLLIIIILLGAYYFPQFVKYLKERKRAKDWDDFVRRSFLDYTREALDEHTEWRNRVILWINSDITRHCYINNSDENFNVCFNETVEIFRLEIVQELKNKYADEYKSRNKKDTSSI